MPVQGDMKRSASHDNFTRYNLINLNDPSLPCDAIRLTAAYEIEAEREALAFAKKWIDDGKPDF